MKKRRKVCLFVITFCAVIFLALRVQGNNETPKIKEENTEIRALDCVEYLIGQDGDVLVLHEGEWINQEDLRPFHEFSDAREYEILEKIGEKRNGE